MYQACNINSHGRRIHPPRGTTAILHTSVSCWHGETARPSPWQKMVKAHLRNQTTLLARFCAHGLRMSTCHASTLMEEMMFANDPRAPKVEPNPIAGGERREVWNMQTLQNPTGNTPHPTSLLVPHLLAAAIYCFTSTSGRSDTLTHPSPELGLRSVGPGF